MTVTASENMGTQASANPVNERVRGKVVLISGGLGAFGMITARRFLLEGAHVVLADIAPNSRQDVGEVFAGLPAPLVTKLDVTDPASWLSAIEATVKEFGRLDVLVNNAGVVTQVPQAFDEIEIDEWRRVFAINVEGVMLGTQAALRYMKSNGGGAIVNLGSISAYVGTKDNCTYAISKGAVKIMSKAAALSAARFGYNVRVNTVHPGYVWTQLIAEKSTREHGSAEAAKKLFASMNPSNRLVEPEDVAAAIVYLASDDAKMINGADLVVDGGRLIQ
jgi:NAD(P)-dependent dehydrogenase (short-subunit alcohol dehydrogenase family)